MKNTTRLTIRYFIKHMANYKLIFTIMVIGLTVGALVGVTIPYFFKMFFDILTSGGEPATLAPELIQILLWILGINAFAWIFWRTIEFCSDYFFSRIMADMQNEIFNYLHKHSYTFFNNRFVGALVKKVNKLVGAFEAIVAKFYWDIINIAIVIIAITVVLFFVNTIIAWIVVIWAIAFMAFNYIFAMYKLKYDIARSECETQLTATLADTITNNINVKLFTSHNLEEDRYRKITETWRQKAKKAWNLGSMQEAVQATLVILLEFALFYFGVRFWEQGLITIGDFVLIQGYFLQILYRLWDFGRILKDIYANFGDAEEMILILNTPHEIKDAPDAKQLKISRGEIDFKNVEFAYEGGRNVINNLDLKIKGGEKIALIGPSGGGKSTIVKLLFRFFDINSGQLKIDGQDVREVSQVSLLDNLSLVPQDPMLFHRTLMENIRYGRPQATDEEVVEAAKKANCHQFISRFPSQYETFVGERGVKLSGGERQRVAIARAILKNAPILVLDEATSSLDSESEALIQEALEKLMEGKTTIVIAHRLSTIMQMDRIIVIKDGAIHETGTHKELTKRPDSLYKMLWELQAGGFISETT